jgi:hypothetical protein
MFKLNQDNMKPAKPFLLLIIIFMSTLSIGKAQAQQDKRKFRIAKIEVYPQFLNEYKLALAEHASVAVKAEPGVLSLQGVYFYACVEDNHPHKKTANFLKYKNGTLKMVKSLELIEVSPIGIEIKPELLTTNK